MKGLFLLADVALSYLFVGRAQPVAAVAEAPEGGGLAVAQTLQTSYWLHKGGSGSDMPTLYPVARWSPP